MQFDTRRAGVTKTAREVVEAYNRIVWNQRNFALARELFGDNVIRHGIGEVQTLSREQACQRIEDVWALFDSLHFDLTLVVEGADDEHVALLYDSTMTTKDGIESKIASIEVFRVVNGQIIEVYNVSHQPGVWT